VTYERTTDKPIIADGGRPEEGHIPAIAGPWHAGRRCRTFPDMASDVSHSAAAVLLDVDGVLNPARRTRGYRRHRAFPIGVALKLWLNPEHGPMLRELIADTGAELVWATYWRDHANKWISPRVGLPSLRYVPIPPYPRDAAGRPTLGGWKARHVAAWAGTRPFVWFEDEPDAADSLAASPNLGPYLVVPVDSVVGLTADHVAMARDWLSGI
jgi:hypothetical protein